MKKKTNILMAMSFILGAWFFSSALIDFVAIPAVFRNVSRVAEAGTVGMIVFSKFNLLEVLFGLFLVVLFYFAGIKTFRKTLFTTLSILFIIACIFNFKFSPNITNINQEIYEKEAEGDRLEKLKKEHNWYHQNYVRLEKVKMTTMLITIILFIVAINKDKENEL